jgi:hypothetical protein
MRGSLAEIASSTVSYKTPAHAPGSSYQIAKTTTAPCCSEVHLRERVFQPGKSTNENDRVDPGSLLRSEATGNVVEKN